MRHTLNDRFFEVIDSEQKAYWLGFLAADGCVANRQVIVALQRRDRAHLELFLQHLESTQVVRDYMSRRQVGPSGGVIEPKPGSRVVVSRKVMVEDLARHGIVPRKSLTLEPWRGPGYLMRHYWRGVIDGDGSIFRTNQGEWRISLVGSPAVVQSFRDWAFSLCGSQAAVVPKYKSFTLSIGGQSVPQMIVKALYLDCKVALNRKRTTAEELMCLTLRGPNGRRADVDWEQVQSAYQQGASTVELSHQFAISHSQIAKGLRRLGVTIRTRSEAMMLSDKVKENALKGAQARWKTLK